MTERISASASGPSAVSSSTSSTVGLLDGRRHRSRLDEPGALRAFDQHAHRAVGQLQQLHRRGDHAEVVERVAVGIVLGRIELGDQEQLLVRRHRRFQRGDGFLAPDEQRHDPVREDDDVAKGKYGKGTSCHGRLYGRARCTQRNGRDLAEGDDQAGCQVLQRMGGGGDCRRPTQNPRWRQTT